MTTLPLIFNHGHLFVELDMAYWKRKDAEKTIEILKLHGAKTLFQLPGMNPRVTVHDTPESPRQSQQGNDQTVPSRAE